uniref:Uncharacterized protein n=1 Tax=Anopheles albimanus TaxID=7167 RepID=A0A182FCZ3_ANOAL
MRKNGRFNERLLELTQDAFSKLGFHLFDPTGEPASCLQSLVKESLKPTSKAPKEPKRPKTPLVSENPTTTNENLTSQLNLQLEQAGDVQYRISNLLAIIESHEERILSLRPELMKTIEDADAPLAQRATEMKQMVYEKAKAERSSMQQQELLVLMSQTTNPSRKKTNESKATEFLIQQKEREFQLLSAFFKYIVSDLTTRRNVNRVELAADLRGIRQALQLLLDQPLSPIQLAATMLERPSAETPSSSACSSKHEQKYSTMLASSERAQGSKN